MQSRINMRVTVAKTGSDKSPRKNEREVERHLRMGAYEFIEMFLLPHTRLHF